MNGVHAGNAVVVDDETADFDYVAREIATSERSDRMKKRLGVGTRTTGRRGDEGWEVPFSDDLLSRLAKHLSSLGAKLPSERVIAETLGVSRNALWSSDAV